MNLHNMLGAPVAWLQGTGDVAISSRVRLARNLDGRPFPGRASAPALAAARKEIVEAARRTRAFRNAPVIYLDDVEPVDRAFLVERHLISRPLAAHPASRAVVVSEAERRSLMVNEEDHLRLQALGPGLAASELWRDLDRADTELGRALRYAYDPRLGYLTAHPSNLGTGLRASCLVHLPALGLGGAINRVLEALPEAGLTVRGAFGEGTRVLGDLYQVSNASSLGRTEGEIAADVDRLVDRLRKAEGRARESLFEGPARLGSEDLVWRSLGALTHARRLSYEEAVSRLSAVRMGLAAGLDLRPASAAKVDDLLFHTRPAHLQMLARRELGPEERDALRAATIRARLS